MESLLYTALDRCWYTCWLPMGLGVFSPLQPRPFPQVPTLALSLPAPLFSLQTPANQLIVGWEELLGRWR